MNREDIWIVVLWSPRFKRYKYIRIAGKGPYDAIDRWHHERSLYMDPSWWPSDVLWGPEWAKGEGDA